VRRATDPFDFGWYYSRGGYRWITTTAVNQPSPPPALRGKASEDARARHALLLFESQSRRWLTDGVPSGDRAAVIRYSLRRYGGAFREFAATDPTEACILSFADSWGALLGPEGSLIRLEEGGRILTHGEPFELWADEIQLMNGAVELWDQLQGRNIAWMKEVIRWIRTQEFDGVEYRPGGDVRIRIASVHSLAALFKDLRQGELERPALYYLQHVVNERVEVHTSARLLWEQGRTRLRLRVTPHNLLGCLWLQLARAIDGDRRYQQCEACRGWFELGRDDRGDRIYCTLACKQWAFRDRAHRKRGLVSLPRPRGPRPPRKRRDRAIQAR
jgi:hypothetical protein